MLLIPILRLLLVHQSLLHLLMVLIPIDLYLLLALTG